MAQSVLRWAGSKRLLVGELTRYIPMYFDRYVEPFAGSAALYFSIQPNSALLTDLNHELVTTYRALRRDASLVLECFNRIPDGEDNYYIVRGADTNGWPDSLIAARFLYLNRYCFNGLYRTNASGRFNVPYGPPRKPIEGFTNRLLEAGRLLDRAQIKAQDFEKTISEAKEGDFYYLDPPYAVDDKRIFREYIPGSFSKKDLERLSESLKYLDNMGVIFLLSYADGPEGRKLANRWSHKYVYTRRHMAGFVANRRMAVEILVSNRTFEGY